jgi:hypothetical protein
MRIPDKKTFYEMYEKGAFGNKLRTWDSIYDFFGDCDLGWRGKVSMRYRGAGGGGFCKYNVTCADANAVLDQWVREGADPNLVVLNESAPDDRLVWQGELLNAVDGWVLRYSEEKAKMRDAMTKAQQIRGIAVIALMKYTMTPSSYEDVMAIFDLFPDSVVELSVYAHRVGVIPGRNTVIWEVRNY